MAYSRKGKRIYNGHKMGGCPRCGGSSAMTETLYKGNFGVLKPCCIDCEPEVIDKKKRDVERVRQWRTQQCNIKERRNEEARLRLLRHGDKVRAYRRNYYQKNKEFFCEYRRAYIKENPWFNRAASSRKRALVRERMPKWSDIEELKMFYKNCPEGMVVDHIIPLKGKNISGLHIASNLQYLTFEENSKKSNKYDILAVGMEPVKIWGKEI